jgi:hypothetical protein
MFSKSGGVFFRAIAVATNAQLDALVVLRDPGDIDGTPSHRNGGPSASHEPPGLQSRGLPQEAAPDAALSGAQVTPSTAAGCCVRNLSFHHK